MTPKLNQPPRSPGALYTDAHARARCSVERTIGVLKGDVYVKKEVYIILQNLQVM